MFNIFQIGDVRLHAHITNTPLLPLSVNGKSENFASSGRVALAQNRYAPDARKGTVRLAVYGDGIRNSDNLFQHLYRLLGLPTDVIAYQLLNPGMERSGKCVQCCSCYGEMLWLHTRGVIQKITPKSDDGIGYEATIQLETEPIWKPLNRILWHQVSGTGPAEAYLNEVTLTSPYTNYLTPYPTAEELFSNRRAWFWHKRNCQEIGVFYAPDYATALHTAESTTYPATGKVVDWDTGAQGFGVFINPDIWSMPSQGVYLFRGMTSVYNGVLSVRATVPSDIWATHDETLTIDMQEVNSLMTTAGYTLTTTDIVVVGDVLDAPGFVLRGNTVLVQIAEALTRTGGAAPGQLLPGMNRVYINPLIAEYAMHHIFRRA